jgi:protein maelstrom
MNNQGGNNNASNPFQLFVLDFKDKQEKRGIFYRSQSEATDAAQPYWTQLSQREKQEYTQKANFPKRASNVSTCSSKLTSQGIPLEEMERRKQEEIRKRKEMEQKIEKTLRDAYEDQTLVDLQFNIFATTDFCQTLTGDIFAAELAMAKFSLRSGVVDSIHMQINPGKLPLGFRASAQEKSDSTHKLKIPPEASGESNYFRIYKTITKFIANGGSKNFPYIFTHNEILNTARLTIRKILEETEAVDDIQVYSIEEFFGPLKKYTMKIKQEGIPSQANKLVVRDVLDRDPYAYQMGIGCEVRFFFSNLNFIT